MTTIQTLQSAHGTRELAARLGVHRSSVTKWIAGSARPSVRACLRIAALAAVPEGAVLDEHGVADPGFCARELLSHLPSSENERELARDIGASAETVRRWTSGDHLPTVAHAHAVSAWISDRASPFQAAFWFDTWTIAVTTHE